MFEKSNTISFVKYRTFFLLEFVYLCPCLNSLLRFPSIHNRLEIYINFFWLNSCSSQVLQRCNKFHYPPTQVSKNLLKKHAFFHALSMDLAYGIPYLRLFIQKKMWLQFNFWFGLVQFTSINMHCGTQRILSSFF